MRITPYFLKNGHIAAGVGLVILGLFTLSAGVVPAQAYDACASPKFGASRIMVDEHAETAEDAQINGMRRATEMAFARVLSRLLRDPAIVDAFIETHEPDQFVDFFHIASENTLAGRISLRLIIVLLLVRSVMPFGHPALSGPSWAARAYWFCRSGWPRTVPGPGSETMNG